jgi:hypothetical protein
VCAEDVFAKLLTEEDLHPHLKARMQQRGVTKQEIERTLNEGWKATDAKPGTLGKVMVFSYQAEWEGQFYEEKEVTVYYKIVDEHLILLTVKARYGKNFPRGE